MPPIVIDLLSSPDQPVRPTVVRSTSLSSKTTTRKRKLNYKPPEPDDDGWQALSSDDLPSTLPPTKPAILAPANSKSNISHEQSEVTNKELAWKLQAECDKEDIIVPRASTSAVATGGNEFFFLSDDFDSTVNLDDSLPVIAVKKRRFTPSPEAQKAKAPRAAGYKRSSSNIENSLKPVGSRASTGLERSKTTGAIVESDPITFTSSPDPVADAARRKKDKGKKLDILDEDDDDPFNVNLDQISQKNALYAPSHSKASTTLDNFDFDDSSDIELPDIGSISSTIPPSLSRGGSQATIRKYKADKAAEKKTTEKTQKKKQSQAVKEAKAAEREAEKERKRIEKEEKAAQKERAAEIAKVNTLRTDKKVSSPEMIVDLPSCLEVKLVSHVKSFLAPLQVEHSQWESPVGPVIKWRRKVEAKYDEEAGHFLPCPKHIKEEDHVMYVMSAQEFVDMATGEEGKDLDAHILRLKSKFHKCTVIYLIEGLTLWMRKNKNVKNRAFVAAVRGEEEPAPSQSQRRKKKQHEYVDEDLLEDALLRLQVMHKPLIHHTNATIESAQWVIAFTQHISTIPYRQQKDSLDTTFSMESGQVKTGEDAADTFIKMLSEIKMLTPAVAWGIAADFPSVPRLVKGLQDKGQLALQDCNKCANKNGAITDKRVGPAVSKRVYKIFMGRDESEVV